jgi:type II secretory pathway pseudopilin PulG
MKGALALVAVAAFTATATADVLWDQSNYNSGINAFVDQEFDDFPSYSSYMVMDVVSTGWTVQSVSVYFTLGSGNWANVNQARLNYFAKTGNLPVAADDPTAGATVGVSLTNLGDTWEITASGLNVNLPAGEWWIGLTPLTNFASQGQEFHRAAPIMGVDTAWRNPGGGFALGTQWQTTAALGTDWVGVYDGAFKVLGIPAPGALALLGLAGLLGRRRR